MPNFQIWLARTFQILSFFNAQLSFLIFLSFTLKFSSILSSWLKMTWIFMIHSKLNHFKNLSCALFCKCPNSFSTVTVLSFRVISSPILSYDINYISWFRFQKKSRCFLKFESHFWTWQKKKKDTWTLIPPNQTFWIFDFGGIRVQLTFFKKAFQSTVVHFEFI